MQQSGWLLAGARLRAAPPPRARFKFAGSAANIRSQQIEMSLTMYSITSSERRRFCMRLTGTCRTDHAELPPARPLGDDLGEISASSHLVDGVNVYARPVLHEHDHAAELLDHPQDAARLGRLGRIHRRPA